MGIFSMFKKDKEMKNQAITKEQYKTITESLNSFTSWGGNSYDNDLVRSIVRVKSQAVGKAVPKHIRRSNDNLVVNPEPYIKELLFEPNPLMTMQQLLEKTISQLEMNNNAFIFIYRDDNGYPMQLLPINSTSVTPAYNAANKLFLVFDLENGKKLTAAYTDIIHLRKDFNEGAIFGTSPHVALKKLMGLMHTMDEGLVNSIKSSAVIRWLLKFNQTIRPEDLKAQTENFAESFLKSDNGTGVAATDNKAEAIQIKDYTKTAPDGDREGVKKRLLMFFNINEEILIAKYKEDDYTSFYETSVEPIVRQLSNEFTRKLFTKKERSYGNEIVFDAFDLAFASFSTRLSMYQMVDRKSLTSNEWRGAFNLAPHPEGDEFLLRLDTQSQNDRNSQKGN